MISPELSEERSQIAAFSLNSSGCVCVCVFVNHLLLLV